MRIAIVSHRELSGGAARAAYRLHRALIDDGEDSRMYVGSKRSDDWTVCGPTSKFGKAIGLIRPTIGNLLTRLQMTENKNLHSVNILPSNLSNVLNNSDVEVVNLHWVAGETMSIEDIGRIQKPVVWTLHDMWAFCGAEHIEDSGSDARWRSGYDSQNKLAENSGLDINKWIWKRKKRAWKTPMYIVSPSRWLADNVRESALMREWPVTVIPNVLDTEVFKPLDQAQCRIALNLPIDKKIILFGAIGGGADMNKGYDLLILSLCDLADRYEGQIDDVLCVVFGQNEPRHMPELPFSIRWMGIIHDEISLVLLYSAADVMVVPSRLENLPQTGTEAHACGCPVVAFNTTGLIDVVGHKNTGYLAKNYDVCDLGLGIKWVLDDEVRRLKLGRNARDKAVELWSTSVVIQNYKNLYHKLIK